MPPWPGFEIDTQCHDEIPLDTPRRVDHGRSVLLMHCIDRIFPRNLQGRQGCIRTLAHPQTQPRLPIEAISSASMGLPTSRVTSTLLFDQ